MKHICGENGCRWVTNEEYERLMKLEQEKVQPQKVEVNINKKKSLFMRMIKK